MVRLDCGHEQPIDKKDLPRARHRCPQCTGDEHSAVTRPPLREVVGGGRDKEGVYEVLKCGHTLYDPKGRAKHRRCAPCLEEGRS